MAPDKRHDRWLERLDALFAYRLPQQLAVLLYKNGGRPRAAPRPRARGG
jgi:hypothetical protein